MEHQKIRSLIIDDDPFMISILQDLLMDEFDDIEIIGLAGNGNEGILKIKETKPDLIFLDVEMHDMTGFEMLQTIKKQDFHTIFVTSYDHYALKALRMNALDYLVKPIKLDELKQAVNKYRLKAKKSQRNATIKQTLSNLENLVLNILPEDIAREIQVNGSSKSKRFELATVLFADIKGFTKYAELYSPEELVEELNLYYSAFDQLSEKFGVEKIKTIGDCYMATGGVPIANKSNPMDIVKFAFAMRDYNRKVKDTKLKLGKSAFDFRIGIHSGPVVAGIVGIKKFAYDIWGDTVNIASRLEECGESDKINISGSTYALLKSLKELKFIPRGFIETKGKGQMEMFFVEQS
jgi:class 3 adenylate cyclase